MTHIAKDIAGACDCIIKMDTDEFLAVYDDSAKALTTSISDYLAELRLDGDSRIGYLQDSIPSREVCSKDVYSEPEKFPLSGVSFIGTGEKSWFKAVFDSKIPITSINLGGHANGVKAGIWTRFGIVHYHSRCLAIEVENSKRVLESHGYILPSDTDEEATAKLAGRFRCGTVDICNSCGFKAGFASNHKARFYLQWLNCRNETEAGYYNYVGESHEQQYTEIVKALQTSHELFSL